jgi:hypothetical protein
VTATATSASSNPASNSSQISLSWLDNSTSEDGFKVERCTRPGPPKFTEIATVGANVTAYTDTGLRGNTNYTYRVRAYCGGVYSAYSNAVTAKTLK